MRIEVRPARASDRQSWDEVVSASTNGWLTHTWNWSDVVKHVGYEKDFLVAETEGSAVAVFPNYVRRYGKLRGLVDARVMSSSALGYGGVCIRPGFSAPAVRDAILASVDSKALSCGVIYSEVILQPFAEEPNYLLAHGYSPRPHYTFVVGLDSPREVLWASIGKHSRNDVRRAQKNRITVRPATDETDFEVFYRLHTETYARTGIEPRPRDYFFAIWENLRNRGMAEFIVAELRSKPIACNLILKFPPAALYASGASDSRFRSLGAGSLLQWESILAAKRDGLSVYDLGAVSYPTGSAKENAIYQFKSHWGGRLTAAPGGVKFHSKGRKLLYDLYRLTSSLSSKKFTKPPSAVSRALPRTSFELTG